MKYFTFETLFVQAFALGVSDGKKSKKVKKPKKIKEDKDKDKKDK